MPVTIDEKASDLIEKAYYMWFTTVREDGLPQPTPVWFIRDGDTFVVYSQPGAQKVKNIRANPMVTLNFAEDAEGEVYVVITGEARIEENAPLVASNPAYRAKYDAGIERIGFTVEKMTNEYSTFIRITPTRVRTQ
jgi:PPOX class probable F420-dependent enzyme